VTARLPFLLSIAALSAGVALAVAPRAMTEPAASQPVVVELFQSQGCSSCPPANANLNAIADQPGVLALSFGVTYWDDLGWKDTFATKAGTDRQWDYARGSLHNSNVATPQVVINGRAETVGVDRNELKRRIETAALPANAPAITLSGSTVLVAAGAGPKGGADVWLVRYDPRTVEVAIKRGENGGRTLPHRNVVRELTRLGGWSGAAVRYDLPKASDPAYATAILVQEAHGGPILTALKP
jgi:hypothetical protein